jgi:NADH:ubiquinone oxidoreductase subunit F (NADH-binding)
VLRHLVRGAAPAGWGDYDLPGGDAILRALEAARLRGRGGASYPTAAKWRAARDTPAAERYVVANGDEGDPGSYVDRLLLEEDPHAVLAGMLACARVIGARRGVVYVRAEYPLARARVARAIEEARAAGRLGQELDVDVISGAGSYVCGEETALLRSIEGRRGEPRPKPPFPAQAGLFGRPTVVQNVETLAIVPWVARHGRPTGTKAVCLSGAVARPCVVEVPLGMPLRRVLHQAGGGPAREDGWRMALVGGPLGRVVPEHLFDTPLSYEALPGLGHAGVVVLDERVSPRALAEHLFAFARAESCGTCTPCRAGTARLAGIRDASAMRRLLETLEAGSLCGFGQGVPRPIRDLLEHFGDEVFA